MKPTAIIQRYAAQLEAIGKDLAMNFETPAQRIINAGFERIGVERFTRGGDDLWEMFTAQQNGWEYTKPPRHLRERWASA